MSSAKESLRRWKRGLERSRPEAGSDRPGQADRAFRLLAGEVEEGLRDIDFDEVTTEDRITFVECAVAWQVRRTLRRGRFDLALRLQRFGTERIAQLCESLHGWRPVLGGQVPSDRDVESSG